MMYMRRTVFPKLRTIKLKDVPSFVCFGPVDIMLQLPFCRNWYWPWGGNLFVPYLSHLQLKKTRRSSVGGGRLSFMTGTWRNLMIHEANDGYLVESIMFRSAASSANLNQYAAQPITISRNPITSPPKNFFPFSPSICPSRFCNALAIDSSAFARSSPTEYSALFAAWNNCTNNGYQESSWKS